MPRSAPEPHSSEPRIQDNGSRPYRPIGGQFAGPADDEVLRFLVEIALPERKWVQRMKLRDVIDTQFDQMAGGGFCHD